MMPEEELKELRNRLYLERVERDMTNKVIEMFHLGTSNNHSVESIYAELDALHLKLGVRKVRPETYKNATKELADAKSADRVETIVGVWYRCHAYDKEATANINKIAENKMKMEGWKN